jgi:hypothetical protein
MSKPLIIPAILSTFSSLKDRTLKIVFESSEPTPEQMACIQNHSQKAGFLAFSGDNFTQVEIDNLANIKADFNDTGKTRGQRLRGAIFVLWQQKPNGYDNFDDFYNVYMEKFINHVKGKIE